MWANTCWGLIGLAAACGLAVLGLSPDYVWLRPWLLGAVAVFVVATVICFCWPLLFGRDRQPSNSPAASRPTVKLTYLNARCDYDLGPAIIEMAHGSAWGRWFAARELVNAGKPIDERYWFQTAASMVMDKMRDGELVVRGRLHGQTGSELIPQTDWRDIALYYFPDNRTLWKLRIMPWRVSRSKTVRLSIPT